MNIYLIIFQALKVKNIIQDKKQSDDCLAIITSHFKKTNMIPTEETTKTLKKIRGLVSSSEEKSAIEPIEQEDKKYIMKLIEKNGNFFEIHKESFLGGKNTIKKFDEVMKTLEAIFTGNYISSKVSINAISFDYKELDKLFAQTGIKNPNYKNKDKFIPKTPLNLYISSNKLLSDYLNNDFINDSRTFDELLINILSLLYYFKIPVIGEKWIEHYNVEKEKEKPIIIKPPNKERNEKTNKNEEQSKPLEGLNDIIKEINAILVDLFKVVKENRYK